jgi:ubiquinone/menaquinone biosynthesis C-methylase UbiE
MLNQQEITSYTARGINPERLNAILEYAGHSILDVSCGSGSYVLKLYKHYNICGVDIQHYATWDARSDLFFLSE